MALRYAPRVKETTTTTGTGTYSLAGAVTGFQGFVAGIGSTNTVCYCCTNDVDWEIGVGTVTDSSPDTLSRTTIMASSNSGSAVNWGSGTKNVFCILSPNMLNYFSGNSTGAFNSPSPYKCVLSIGEGNIVSVPYNNTIVFGNTNTITSNDNSYVFGNNNTISNPSTIVGYYNNNAASNGTIIGNYSRILSTAPESFIVGTNSVNRYNPGALLFSTNLVYSPGAFQVQRYLSGKYTFDATTTGIGYEWGSSNEFKQGTLVASANNTASLLYDILVLARQTDGTSGTVGDSKSWRLQAMATESSGTLTQVGSTTTTNIAASTDASAWTVTLNFASTYPIIATGEADKTIFWTAYITVVELSDGYS